MTIEQTDIACPDCGTDLQVIYVTELKQSVSGWACPNCGYIASKREGYEDSVEVSEQEYLMRVEKPLRSSDIRAEATTVEDEFRARAANMGDDELWLLIDPETDEIVDAVVGDAVSDGE
jgi:rubredoxin